MRRQASGLLFPARGASFRSGPQGTVEREAFGRRSHAFATPRPRGLSPADACLPASLRELPRPERGPVGGSRRAHTHARGRQRAGGEGTSRTCEQTGGVAHEAGPIHTLRSRNRKARKMRVQTRFPKLWSAGWGCASRPAPWERSAARHHGRDVVCREPRGIRGEHERNLSLAQIPTSARPECSRRASSWENYLRDHSLSRAR